MIENESRKELSGLIYGILAFGWWGFVFPCVLLALNAAAEGKIESKWAWSIEIMSHRIIWCFLTCIILIHVLKRWDSVWQVMRSKRMLLLLVAAAILIGTNWTCFIYGALTERLNQTSLGYYINPLLNVLLGFMFLGERLRRFQLIAVCFAFGGTIWLTVAQGEIPWIAFIVACTFAMYGLLRKQLKVDSLTGLTFESFYFLPFAVGYVLYQTNSSSPQLFWNSGFLVTFLLMLCGPATAAPLLWFTSAARRLRLGTLGFIQFLAPTGQLIIAVAVNKEPILNKLGGFALIWLAVGIYVWDTYRARPKVKSKLPDHPNASSSVSPERTNAS